MTNQINDTFMQARQGNIAAIIQVMNENLAKLGVRIRAIFSDGVLQVLCEAPEPQHLEKSSILKEVKQTLEEISPRNIQQIEINSRIFKYPQLLWLEDITKNPDNKLLWSQKIILTKPNIFKQIANNFYINKLKRTKIPMSKGILLKRMQRLDQFQPDIIGIFLLSLIMLTLGIQVNRWLNNSWIDQITTSENIASQPSFLNDKKSSEDTELKSKVAFTQAVRLAQKAVAYGKIAKSKEEWMAIAKIWEEAAELMASVSPSYSRHDVALDRAEIYQKNSDIAKTQVEKIVRGE
ncbi:conserved hypothetical protein [Trichodesmium erythraeum IMS101]|uniref:Uncharacterized protein n=1 Tax=Trichodesmium erythraeum (strain IMS101) TaxID=203124 RepID=Q117B0_TRIEI|nr:hypothetical protein [Trichodesmium erythraeum GBRTRLIN201]